jgi:hypothetical protein
MAFAVFRLMTSSNRVGCLTGMSAGFAPRRTLATMRAITAPIPPDSSAFPAAQNL